MDIDLRGDHVGEYLPSVHDNGRRCLVTAGFYCQNICIFLHFFFRLFLFKLKFNRLAVFAGRRVGEYTPNDRHELLGVRQ